MMSRHEEQERARKERLMLEMEWSEQRKLEEQLRQARQRQRQEEIWDTYKVKDAKQVSLALSMCSVSGIILEINIRLLMICPFTGNTLMFLL